MVVCRVAQVCGLQQQQIRPSRSRPHTCRGNTKGTATAQRALNREMKHGGFSLQYMGVYPPPAPCPRAYILDRDWWVVSLHVPRPHTGVHVSLQIDGYSASFSALSKVQEDGCSYFSADPTRLRPDYGASGDVRGVSGGPEIEMKRFLCFLFTLRAQLLVVCWGGESRGKSHPGEEWRYVVLL